MSSSDITLLDVYTKLCDVLSRLDELNGDVNDMCGQLVQRLDTITELVERKKRVKHPETWNMRYGRMEEGRHTLPIWIEGYITQTGCAAVENLYTALQTGQPVTLPDGLYVSLPSLHTWIRARGAYPRVTMPRLRQLLKSEGWTQTTLHAAAEDATRKPAQKRYWRHMTT